MKHPRCNGRMKQKKSNRYTIDVEVDQALMENSPDHGHGWDDLAQYLVAAAAATLDHQQAPAGELAILLTDDERIADLNETYGDAIGPTDVLSFPAGDSPDVPGMAHYFGDVAISLPRAQTQAAAAGHPLQAELQLLAVHAVLHVLGHDHAELKDKERMWAAQDETLAGLDAFS